jgi:hypothetical protein
VNFAGHALVADWMNEPLGDRHAVGFAAMIPDFARMAQVRPLLFEQPTAQLGGDQLGGAPALHRGIHLHHLADSVFHPLPEVVALMRELGARLTALGVRRGPMLATSHIAVEIMLDDAWLAEPGAREFYLACLVNAPAVEFAELEHKRLWSGLLQRLQRIGSSSQHASPEVVTERVGRTLHNRPKLAADERDLRLIERGVASMTTAVHAASARIRSALVHGLRVDAGSAPGR